jgi:hypothetical protein
MRHWFGQSLTDWTFIQGDGDEAVLASGEVTFWDAWSGGTQYTDLLDDNGDAITSVTSSDGSSLPLGTFPRFQGPDGVTYMWADAGSGARFVMGATDLGDDVTALLNEVADNQNAIANLTALAAAAPVTVKYDEGTATWPARPAIAGSRVVFWFGPASSPPPAGYMIENDQFFGWAA